MKRAALEKKFGERQAKSRRAHFRHEYGIVSPTKCEAGRYRKRKWLDCGRPRCGICHGDKRCGHEPTRQELLAELKLRERE